MKLIMRADDVGYTEFANIGTFKAIDEGVITTADVMLDCPGTVDALEKLKQRPWISVGWHTHFWGKPVLPVNEVPSIVDENGFFKWTVKNVKDVPFHRNVDPLKNSCDYDELVKEFRAQILRCIEVLGRAPDTTSPPAGTTPVEKAKKTVCEEFGIQYGWFTKGKGNAPSDGLPALPQYAHLEIFMPVQGNGTNKYMGLPAEGEPERYDVVRGFREDGDNIRDKKIAQLAFHPAYLDDYIMYDGGLDTDFSRIRVMDVHYMCSKELHDYIRDEGIELINQRDALNGTHEYQNHLKLIGSDLCVL